jgi:ABC-type sugar transport system ATPase subunit
VVRAADRLGVGATLDRYPDQLSGGQQQRVALARALLRRPSVFLLDEPLSGLDAQLRASTRALVVELHREVGVTTVVVTHDQIDAMTMADRVAVVADGRLQQLGTPQQVYDRPATAFVAAFVGGPGMNLVPGGEVLGGRPGTLVGLRPEHLRPHEDGQLVGTVERVEPLGSETILWVATGGHLLSVRVAPGGAHRPGDPVRLQVPEHRLHRFAADTGKRL